MERCRTSFQKNIYLHRPQIAKTNLCVITVKNNVTSARSSRQFCLTPNHSTPCNGTQSWHHVHFRAAMAPRPLRQCWPSPSPPHTIAHYNGTLHGTTSTPPKLAVTSPIPHYNGTLQWHPATAPRPSMTIAPCNGTQQWHYVHCTLQWPIRQSGSSPPPPYWK